jgi:signal peptidase I
MPETKASGTPKAGRGDEPRRSALSVIFECVVLLAVAVLLSQVARTWVVATYTVPTPSMVPTIEVGDRFVVDRLVYLYRSPQPGDIVLFDDPLGQLPALVKRVIAVGGHTVDLKDGHVVIDGVAAVEPYTYGKPSLPQSVKLPVTVPAGYVWVMGDNRTDSADSRSFGPVPVSSIHGRAVFTYWPPADIGTLR